MLPVPPRPSSIPSRCDAVIALAHRMEPDGSLNAESRARVAAAAAALRDDRAPLLVCCGWAYDDFEVSMALAMKRYAVERQGIAAERVLTEPAPRDTVGEAVFTKRNFAAPRGWSTVLIVTSDYHLPRALEVFSFVYGPSITVLGEAIASADASVSVATGVGADARTRADSEARSLAAFRDTFRGVAPGDDAAILERLCTRHPYYNGAVHPPIDVHK